MIVEINNSKISFNLKLFLKDTAWYPLDIAPDLDRKLDKKQNLGRYQPRDKILYHNEINK